MENNSGGGFERYIYGYKRAKQEAGKVGEETKGIEVKEFGPIDTEINGYFFELQSRLEKKAEKEGGRFNYNTYAETLWKEVLDGGQSPERLQTFNNLLVRELHKIDMTEHVYEHVQQSLIDLVEQYSDKVKNIALWSTGDTSTTGYQAGKIHSAEIIKNYLAAVRELKKPKIQKGQDNKKEKTADQKYLDEKTAYMVDDNKFSRLVSFMEGKIPSEGDEKVKIVIIEDSRGNFAKAEKALTAQLGEKMKNVEIIPIWAAYSREGIQAQEKAQKDANPDEAIERLHDEKEKLNTIHSFKELKGEKFQEILSDAYVFVDFDGVIGNNVTMRQSQARAIYDSLMTTVVDENHTEEKIKQEMIERIRSMKESSK